MKRISTLMITLMALLMLPLSANGQVDVANIAAFNAVEDGTLVKLTLTNARVNALNTLANPATYYIEDASGATAVKGISLTTGKLLNGYIVGKKATEDVDYVNTPSQGYEYSLNVEDPTLSSFTTSDATMTGTSMTIAEACKQENYGKLVTLSDVTIAPIGNGKNLQLTDASGTMKTRDLFFALPWDYTWPNKATSFTGIVLYYMTGWFIMPLAEGDIVPYVQPTEVTFDFSNGDFHEIGTGINDKKGWFINETLTVDNVNLQVTGGSAPSRIYNSANGVILSMFNQFANIIFKAPEGFAVTQIEFTNVNADTQFAFTPSSGSFEGKTWKGNAEGVRMLNTKSPQITKITVTLSAKNSETINLPTIEYTECTNIAAFNALAAGTYAKVTLTDAEVIGKSADGYSTVWIQDATGGCWIQYTSLNDKLNEKTKVNGTVYVIARPNSGNVQMKEAEATLNSDITATDISEYTIIEGTLAEVNVPANKNKVVKISGASLDETDATKGTLTQGEATIAVNNGNATANQQLHKISDWVANTKLENITIVGILVGNSSTNATINQLLPISITNTTGINGISTNEENNKDVVIYNLQGVRQNGLKKGINIVNGKKIIVR